MMALFDLLLLLWFVQILRTLLRLHRGPLMGRILDKAERNETMRLEKQELFKQHYCKAHRVSIWAVDWDREENFL